MALSPTSCSSRSARDPAVGLLQLGMAEVSTALPAALAYWRDLAMRFVAAVCARGEELATPIQSLDDATRAALAASAPPMIGGEYLDPALLATLWEALADAFAAAVRRHGGTSRRCSPSTMLRGNSWAACTSTSPRIAGMMTPRSRFSRPTRRGLPQVRVANQRL